MEPLIGMIVLFAGNFAPRGWAFCDGSLLSISQYQALFSILGTTYGGNGQTTFALPDLRGRVPLSAGQGPGLTVRPLGAHGGAEQTVLTSAQLPSHSHPLNAKQGAADDDLPTGNLLAGAEVFGAGSPDSVMNAEAIGSTGGSTPVGNMQPFLALNYIIALEGIYPSRS